MLKNFCDCCGKELEGIYRLEVRYESLITLSLWEKEYCSSCCKRIKKEIWKALTTKQEMNE